MGLELPELDFGPYDAPGEEPFAVRSVEDAIAGLNGIARLYTGAMRL